MDSSQNNFDAIICGTGMLESMLSCILCQEEKKVLQLDRNNYYGGESASINLQNLWKIHRKGDPPEIYGKSKDWNIDLIPKLLMSCSDIIKIILKTEISQYLEWKATKGSFVYQMKASGGSKIDKVPCNQTEILASSLMDVSQQNKYQNFLDYVSKYDSKNTKDSDLDQLPFKEIVNKFELDPNTVDLIGHTLAFETNDLYLEKPAIETIKKIQLYFDSNGRYGDTAFIYPIYGMGGIQEAFARKASIHGANFLLSVDVEEILFENGQVCGIKSQKISEAMGFDQIKCKMLICDPSYAIKVGLQHKVKSIGKIIRCICILKNCIPTTNELVSISIVFPQKQTGRNNDIFVLLLSSEYQVCSKGYYIAIISTKIETENPEKELDPAFEIIGPVLEKFITITDQYVPTDDGTQDKIFVSPSLDPSFYLDSIASDFLKKYFMISGKEFILEKD